MQTLGFISKNLYQCASLTLGTCTKGVNSLSVQTLATSFQVYMMNCRAQRGKAVFCPHWSVVVGPTTTQPHLTTTQSTNRVRNC